MADDKRYDASGREVEYNAELDRWLPVTNEAAASVAQESAPKKEADKSSDK